MPQETVIVYSTDDGTPIRMHSVDADEAVRLGDYTRQPPGGKDPDPQQLAAANAALRSVGGTIHPELMSPEERAAARAKAAEEAAALAGTAAPAPAPAAAPAARSAPPRRESGASGSSA